jgi:epoxyqueuosine reductase QueG
VAVPRRDLYHAAADARCAPRRSLRHLHRLPGCLPHRRLSAPYQLDARACISYLTIEHKGPVDERYRAALGNRIYGCDDCLAVCPWNRFAKAAADNRAFLPRAELVAPRLAELLALDDATFRQVFAGSPIKRIGRNRMVRNCLYAAGNSGDPRWSRRCAPCSMIPIRWWPMPRNGPWRDW